MKCPKCEDNRDLYLDNQIKKDTPLEGDRTLVWLWICDECGYIEAAWGQDDRL